MATSADSSTVPGIQPSCSQPTIRGTATSADPSTMATRASVFFAPVRSRPLYDHSRDEDEDDEVCVVSIGRPFRYIIPSFNVIAVELRQIRIRGYNSEGEGETYDLFIRNDTSLSRSYPAWMTVKDGTVVDVSWH